MVYLTSHPVVRIHSSAMFKEYQKRGRYPTVEADSLVFSRKKLKNHQAKLPSGNVLSGQMDFQDISLLSEDDLGKSSQERRSEEESFLEKNSLDMKMTKKTKLEKEEEKVLLAVKRLTIDPGKTVKHKESLEDSAQKLNLARLSKKTDLEDLDFVTLKSKLCSAQNEMKMSQILWDIPFFRARFSTLMDSRYLEQLLNLSSVSESPLLKFPPDINRNLYSDVIDLALNHAPDFLLLIINLVVKHEDPLNEKDVIKVAFLFSQFAGSVNAKNNVLRKILSINMKCNGMTNLGLDCQAPLGTSETSRAFRNDRDFLASISDELLKSYAKTMMAQAWFQKKY